MFLLTSKQWLLCLLTAICLMLICYWVLGSEVKIVGEYTWYFPKNYSKKFQCNVCLFLDLPLAKIRHSQQPLANTLGNYDVTSLSVDNFDYEEELVVLYNRVPKTGSTTFVNIAYDLCKRNRFHVLHINITANSHVLSLPNQVSYDKPIRKCSTLSRSDYTLHHDCDKAIMTLYICV